MVELKPLKWFNRGKQMRSGILFGYSTLRDPLWQMSHLLLLLPFVIPIQACQSGWKGEIYQFDHQRVENSGRVQSVREQIIQGTRSSVVWEEIDVKTPGGEPWPGAPIDKDGNKVHEYFCARFHGLLDVPKDGDYEFHLRSDDGSELFIDGQMVRSRKFRKFNY